MTAVEAAQPVQKRTARSRRLTFGLRVVQTGPFLILILLCAAIGIATPVFLTPSNIADVGTQSSVVAVLSLGQFMVILTRGIDLSVGSVLSLTSVVGAMLFVNAHLGNWSILAMVLVGAAIGWLNGVVFVKWKIPHPFIVTLGMFNVAAGVALLISSGSAILGAPPLATFLGNEAPLGVPNAVLFTAVLAALAWVFTQRVQVGRWLYAYGGSPEGARRASIPVNKVLIMAYALSGFFAACGAIIILGRTGSGYPTAGLTLELQSIAAVIIGGTSFFGGRGNVGNVIVGALILGVIQNGLNLLSVSSFYQQVTIGVIVVLAVGVDVFRGSLERSIRSLEARDLVK